MINRREPMPIAVIIIIIIWLGVFLAMGWVMYL